VWPQLTQGKFITLNSLIVNKLKENEQIIKVKNKAQ
jgi:hypothetical protein